MYIFRALTSLTHVYDFQTYQNKVHYELKESRMIILSFHVQEFSL